MSMVNRDSHGLFRGGGVVLPITRSSASSFLKILRASAHAGSTPAPGTNVSRQSPTPIATVSLAPNPWCQFERKSNPLFTLRQACLFLPVDSAVVAVTEATQKRLDVPLIPFASAHEDDRSRSLDRNDQEGSRDRKAPALHP